MANRENTPENLSNKTKRLERAHRILDTAAALILRWGYDKTTIDDIAKQSGVAKGTIYLHWKTREDLLSSLIEREKLAMARDIKEQILASDDAITLSAIFRYSALAHLKRPLLKSILLNETAVVGKITQGSHSAMYLEQIQAFMAYLKLLRGLGVVRTEPEISTQAYMLAAIYMGFLSTQTLIPKDFTLNDEELAEALAFAIRRTFEPLESKAKRPQKAEKQLREMFLGYINAGIALAEGLLQQTLIP